MFRSMNQLSKAQRRLIFFMIFGGILLALIGVTAFLVGTAVNGSRQTAVSLVDTVSVRQYAALPDNDAYPAAVAVAPDGTVYTGSYATGAVWSIDAAGVVTEIPDTRETLGAVAGLTVAPDGSLLVVDQIDTDPRTSGGAVARVTFGDGGAVDAIYALPPTDDGFIAPNDIVTTPDGLIYVTDSGSNQLWRFNADGSGGDVWWVPPVTPDAQIAITGLAYDGITNALIITEPELGVIYRAALPSGDTTTLYEHRGAPNSPGFDGAAVGADGSLYVAALGQNGVVRILPATPDDTDLTDGYGGLEYIAGLFRGSSDVAFRAPNQLIVANFDQSALVLPLVEPELPFALDVIELGVAPATIGG